MPNHDEDNRILLLIIAGAFLFGTVLVAAGVVLVYFGATGDTEFSFFGQSFKSANVGIGAIFIGGVVVVLLVRRVLRIIESREKKALRAASEAINITNRVADQLTDLVDRTGLPEKTHSMMIEGRGSSIVANERGTKVRTITADDLKNMPAELLDHVLIYEKALRKKYARWKDLYPRRGDPATDRELRKLGASMREDLDGVLGFLESSGLQLADHYLQFRHVIRRAEAATT